MSYHCTDHCNGSGLLLLICANDLALYHTPRIFLISFQLFIVAPLSSHPTYIFVSSYAVGHPSVHTSFHLYINAPVCF